MASADLFNRIDANNDGVVSREEFEMAMQMQAGAAMPAAMPATTTTTTRVMSLQAPASYAPMSTPMTSAAPITYAAPASYAPMSTPMTSAAPITYAAPASYAPMSTPMTSAAPITYAAPASYAPISTPMTSAAPITTVVQAATAPATTGTGSSVQYSQPQPVAYAAPSGSSVQYSQQPVTYTLPPITMPAPSASAVYAAPEQQPMTYAAPAAAPAPAPTPAIYAAPEQQPMTYAAPAAVSAPDPVPAVYAAPGQQPLTYAAPAAEPTPASAPAFYAAPEQQPMTYAAPAAQTAPPAIYAAPEQQPMMYAAPDQMPMTYAAPAPAAGPTPAIYAAPTEAPQLPPVYAAPASYTPPMEMQPAPAIYAAPAGDIPQAYAAPAPVTYTTAAVQGSSQAAVPMTSSAAAAAPAPIQISSQPYIPGAGMEYAQYTYAQPAPAYSYPGPVYTAQPQYTYTTEQLSAAPTYVPTVSYQSPYAYAAAPVAATAAPAGVGVPHFIAGIIMTAITVITIRIIVVISVIIIIITIIIIIIIIIIITIIITITSISMSIITIITESTSKEESPNATPWRAWPKCRGQSRDRPLRAERPRAAAEAAMSIMSVRDMTPPRKEARGAGLGPRLTQLEDQLSPQWTREHLCLYADDSHLRFQFESFEEFTSIMNDVRVVFVCFRKFHLQINMAKTQAILKLVGTLKHRVHKEYVRKHQATKRLLLSPRDPERWLPLVPQAEYLGMIISYDHFEQQIYTVTFSEQTRHRNNLYEPQGMEELEEFFGGLPKQGVSRSLELPNKRRRPALGQPRDDLPSHPSLLVSLAKQVVRQEEEIKLLKQDHALVFFLRPGENSMINHLFQTAKTFKAKQAANPQWAPGQQPLKVIMAIAIFKELGARLEALCQDQARLAQVKEYGWRDPATGWKYQRWNPQLKALEEDSSRGPISDQMVANHLQKLCQALAQDTVHRFHCTRRLADVVESPATFQMDLSTRFAYKREALKPSPAIAKIKVIQWLLDLDATRIELLGTGRAFFQSLQQLRASTTKTLMQDMLWRMLVAQWTDCHRQHDVAEFISHIVQRHGFAVVQGTWQARRFFEGEFQIRDEGTCSQPLLLHMPAPPPGLDSQLQVQSLIDFWSGAQESIHALLHAPNILMLQLDRFHNRLGRVHKRQDAVEVNREIMVPFFADHRLYIELAHYRLVATIMHHGSHPRISLIRMQKAATFSFMSSEEDDLTVSDTLADHPIFRPCDQMLPYSIAAQATRIHLAPGEVLSTANGGPAYAVERGTVEVRVADGPPVLFGPGQVFNVVGFLGIAHEAEPFKPTGMDPTQVPLIKGHGGPYEIVQPAQVPRSLFAEKRGRQQLNVGPAPGQVLQKGIGLGGTSESWLRNIGLGWYGGEPTPKSLEPQPNTIL
ncbi:Repetitive proline-rich cell wall protein 2 [Symbiodinium microadriaticum]|uniref:Repetitive proline-rich cell wall protein 2 n=1 Tax=Symbiodinium microadriaticum TaxID=2951 RepID=A0A1Q9EPA0_SYMMI|nr:Repetitive proline-rich cell wall protein 2 [Symbiodinium microadriaticum]